jgi:glyoxylase-like metal-dependent hydrolase (beta-lactamase superfamily II)
MDLRPATELRAVSRSLFGWASFHPQWKVDFNSYALKTAEGVVFIDPLKPEPDIITKLEALGEPIAILLTNAHHDRDADWFRKQYEIQVYAHEKAKADCDTKIDILLMDGERLPGAIKAVHMPGSSAGETAYYARSGGGIVLLGDTLMNQRDKGLTLLPEPYIEDKKQAVKSLHRLLNLNFNIITFAHGDPIVQNARNEIEKFLKKPKRKAHEPATQ